jgi:hypothetical protein
MLNFVKHLIVGTLILVALASCPVKALACDSQCPITPDNAWGYYNGDHFSWSNYDNDVHLLVGFGGALVIGEALTHYAKLPSWEAALIGAVAMGMVGTAKETMFDTWTSRTDIKTWWAGGTAGGLTVIALHF